MHYERHNGRINGARSGFVLTLWTDDPLTARRADAAAVDRVGLDLEVRGKRERQAGLGTWVSEHRIEQLPAIAASLAGASLFARVNPFSCETAAEVELLAGHGVEVLMLPMFCSAEEVEHFVALVAGRAAIVLLLETAQAVADVDRIVCVPGVSEIHIGINDLSIGLGLRSRFEVLDCEATDRVCAHVRGAKIRLGIGGIGRVDDLDLPIPSDLIYAQYPRLGATAALLSRAFMPPDASDLGVEVRRARARMARWQAAAPLELDRARLALRERLADCEHW
jgi:hypothetical protein